MKDLLGHYILLLNEVQTEKNVTIQLHICSTKRKRGQDVSYIEKRFNLPVGLKTGFQMFLTFGIKLKECWDL